MAVHTAAIEWARDDGRVPMPNAFSRIRLRRPWRPPVVGNSETAHAMSERKAVDLAVSGGAQ
jgi:hypothetical protein